MKLAQALLCQQAANASLDPCGECESCRLWAAGNHPDLLQVAKPADKSFIPIDLLLGSKEKRMREGLCHDLGLKPFLGGRRVAIIDDADLLNLEGANCLLKTLEEPPPRSVLLLIGTSAAAQLPTIRSRCQIVRFRPLANDVVEHLLLESGLAEGPEQAQALATLADGSLQRGQELAADEFLTFRNHLIGHLASGSLDSVEDTASGRPGDTCGDLQLRAEATRRA